MRAISLLILLQAVAVQPQTPTLVSSLQRLHDICGSGADFDACTLFVAYKLDIKCAAGREWTTMNASVIFRPLIFLYNIRQLPHEQLHIGDVRLYASQYVDEIETLRFASTNDCEEEARRLTGGFGAKMHEFARRSNLERHPSLRAAGVTMAGK